MMALVRGVILRAISSGSGWKRFFSSKAHAYTTEASGDGGVAGEKRIGKENFVAGVDERHHRHEERELAAGGDDDILGRDFDAAGSVEVGSDLLFESGNAGNRAVAVFSIAKSFLERDDDGRVGMKIWLTQLKMNDGFTGRFEFFSTRVHGERAFAGHHGHAGSNGTHQAFFLADS